jgi:uncharacterized protein (TIGR00369 family)
VSGRTRWDALIEGDFDVPAHDTLGFELAPTPDPKKEIALSWTVPAELCNSAGTLQGGVMAAFADALLGGAAAAHLADDRYPVLADMHLVLLRPAPAGMKLTGRGRMLKTGQRLLFAEAEIFDENDNLIARATGTGIPDST